MFTEKGINKYLYEGELDFEKVYKFISEHEEKYY